MGNTNQRQAKRTPVTLKIKFKSETINQFIERYSVDISQGGIFIRTKDPLAVGTKLRFEFQLKDSSPLITGDATVVWTRDQASASPGAAPGMGVRFDRLPPESQEVLRTILAQKNPRPPTIQKKKVEGKPAASPERSEFGESPTKVAPSGLVKGLANESIPKRTVMGIGPLRTFDDLDKTPLPSPIPFHTDAEDFPEETFEEATKVAKYDNLVAASARGEGKPNAAGEQASDSGPGAAKAGDADKAAGADEPGAGESADGDTAAGGGDGQEGEQADGRADDSETQAAGDAQQQPGEDARARDEEAPAQEHAGEGAARDEERAAAAEDEAAAEAADDASAAEPARGDDARADDDRGDDDAGEEETQPVAAVAPAAADRDAEDERRGGGAWVAIVAAILLIAAASGYYAITKNRGASAAPAKVAAAAAADAAGAAAPNAGKSAVKPLAPTAVAPERASIVVKSIPSGAKAEVVGGDQSGTTPATLHLDPSKDYKIRVSSPNSIAREVTVHAGQTQPITVVLKPKPRVLRITTQPPGAIVYVNGRRRKPTPVDVPITGALAKARSYALVIRHRGYRRVRRKVPGSATFQPDGDELVYAVAVNLPPLQRRHVVRTQHHAGKTTGGGSTGSASGGGGKGTAGKTTKTTASTSGTAAGGAGGGKAGTTGGGKAGAGGGKAAGTTGGGNAGGSASSATKPKTGAKGTKKTKKKPSGPKPGWM